MPDLDFAVVAAEVLPYAAAPTLLFKLSIKNTHAEERIDAIMLRAQVRLEATKRYYDAETQARLLELFGEPRRWNSTLRSLLWTNVSFSVPSFTGSIVADLSIVCTYDFDVLAAKYLDALSDGEVPLLFLFSGSVLYTPTASGLQIEQIPWEKEAVFRLPVRLWREMMETYFPNSAWLRIRKDLFDRLYSYKGRNALLTWDDALERLLQSDMERNQDAKGPLAEQSIEHSVRKVIEDGDGRRREDR